MKLPYVLPEDIEDRLYFLKGNPEGLPTIKIEGSLGKFGYLVLEFSNGVQARYRILIRDYYWILYSAAIAVKNFSYWLNVPHFSNYVLPEDIIRRLYRSKRYWRNGPPKIILEGIEGHFGRLIFDFSDEQVVYRLYIKDRYDILDAAKFAADNFARWPFPWLED
jgi:hypothetical protein